MIHLRKLVIPMALVLSASACTTLSTTDQATLSTASQNAAAAKQEADQALATSQPWDVIYRIEPGPPARVERLCRTG